MDDVYYFAYGSCMSPADLARDVEEFQLIGPARVRGYRLGFTRYSRARRGGVADLVPDKDGVVEGVLYRLPNEQLPALDEREGAPEHYRREYIPVEAGGKTYEGVLTYVVVDKAAAEIAPHPDYIQTILRGAEAYLSPEYVGKLRETVKQLSERKPGERKAGERGPSEREPADGRRRAGRRRRVRGRFRRMRGTRPSRIILVRRLVG
ncbi:MAG: gamma-glutamylcyclotransferase [Firmicutes bacterium]|nr:gamma-glutamylcyclotransferase [Bacillota bacterium]